jgi:hypothetical protein
MQTPKNSVGYLAIKSQVAFSTSAGNPANQQF